MEELLKYAMLDLAVTLLKIELWIITICLIAVILFKTYAGLVRRKDSYIRKRLSEMIASAISQDKNNLNIPFYMRAHRNFIGTLEDFDRRIKGSEWEAIKNTLIKRYLLKKTKRDARSRLWIKRHLAARCLLLNPSFATEEELLNLLNDKKFLIRVIAVSAIIKASNKKLFKKVIQKMNQETPLVRFPYRDALISADKEKFDWLEEMLEEDSNPNTCCICLDLLSTRTTHNLLPKILPFIYGQHQESRLLAIKILKNIPSREVAKILLHCLNDENWEIRVESLKSLYHMPTSGSMISLQELLDDPVWFVRLQAALVLKKSGEEGIKILSSQNPEKRTEAYEVAQYALQLPPHL